MHRSYFWSAWMRQIEQYEWARANYLVQVYRTSMSTICTNKRAAICRDRLYFWPRTTVDLLLLFSHFCFLSSLFCLAKFSPVGICFSKVRSTTSVQGNTSRPGRERKHLLPLTAVWPRHRFVWGISRHNRESSPLLSGKARSITIIGKIKPIAITTTH